MIYAGSPALTGLRYVVLDEVHYLQDAYRGPVWEEVIIHLPRRGAARVPVGHGVQRRGARRLDRDGAGPDRRVIEEQRPVELRNLYLVGDRRASGPTCCRRSSTAGPTPRPSGSTRHPARPRLPAGPARRPRRRFFTPRRPEVVERLAEREHAAGDLLHLQPRRLRRRRRPPASTPGCGSPRPTSGPASGRSSRSGRRRSPTPTSTCSATTAGWRRSRSGSPPTTPAWCRRSRRRSRRASPRGW